MRQFSPIAAVCYLIAGGFAAQNSCRAQETERPTVAESSQFRSTCSSAEVLRFVRSCDAGSDHISHVTFGTTVQERPMIAAIVSQEAWEIGDRDDRLRILILGNIHSGECAGKEAILMMLRELAETPNHRWLSGLVLVFVPNYNADGNDNMAVNNRPGQIGPENGMGRRENAQGFDLNRDFMKLDSPEARALVRLIDDVDPHLFIDCHTTNGSKHRYALTYDIPHNPTTAETIREYLRNSMMPRITSTLEEQGTLTFYYGNFDAAHTTWTTYGHEPRYSTEYVGLRGRLAILSEAFSYISYRDRIEATIAFVTACIDDAQKHSGTIRQLLHEVDESLIRTADNGTEITRISLDAKLAPFELPVLVKGFRDDKPHDYECRFVGRFEPTVLSDLPSAYLIPSSQPQIVELLQRHGIQVTQLDRDEELTVEVDRIEDVVEAQRPFQQHKMLRVRTARRKEQRLISTGTWRVTTAQPLGRLAACLLEAESNDGIVVWNFLPREALDGQDYPILRAVE